MITNFIKLKFNKKLSFIVALLVPYINFLLLETWQRNPFEIKIKLHILNYIFFFLFFLFIFSLIGKLNFSLILGTVFFGLLGFVNHLVISFRDLPFLAWDIFAFKTALAVKHQYKIDFDVKFYLLLGLYFLLLVLFSKCYLEIKGIKKRLIISLNVFCCIFAYFTILQNPILANRLEIKSNIWSPLLAYQENGLMVSLCYDSKFLLIKKPTAYQTILTEIKKTSEAVVHKDNEDPIKKPNIIVIMNETYSDLKVLGDFETNIDYMPCVNNLSKNTIKGQMYMSVIGGGTANSEFEFLTGSSMFFLPRGSFPYQQYIKEDLPSLVSFMKNQGYYTLGTHCYFPFCWKRQDAYDFFNFDKTKFSHDFKNQDLLRSFISDAAVTKEIIFEYEQRDKTKPFFNFNVTMQNHGGYSIAYDNFQEDVFVTTNNESNVDMSPTNRFLSLIKKSDEALQMLIDYFEEQNEKTIILFFGDHQPTSEATEPLKAVWGSEYSANIQQESYQIVPFIIWANYPIEAQDNIVTSPNYLRQYLLRTAGLELTEYDQFLEKLEKKYPVINHYFALDENGNKEYYYNPEGTMAKLNQELNQYWVMQYNYHFDSNNRMDSFFGGE